MHSRLGLPSTCFLNRKQGSWHEFLFSILLDCGVWRAVRQVSKQTCVFYSFNQVDGTRQSSEWQSASHCTKLATVAWDKVYWLLRVPLLFIKRMHSRSKEPFILFQKTAACSTNTLILPFHSATPKQRSLNYRQYMRKPKIVESTIYNEETFY